jgi:hypothetical protein
VVNPPVSLNRFKATAVLGSQNGSELPPPVAPSLMFRHLLGRRLLQGVLACYALILATVMVAPCLSDVPLGPLCSSKASNGWTKSIPTDDGPTSDVLACAACLPLQLTAAAVPGLPIPAFDTELWWLMPPTPFIDPLRVALPPARGPPFV